MKTEKLAAMLRKQAALVAKVTDGTATPAEREELAQITATVQATADLLGDSATQFVKMTLKEFQTATDAFLSALDVAPADQTAAQKRAEDLAVIKRNLAAVKAQGAAKEADEVLVEQMPTPLVPATTPDPMTVLTQRLAERVAALEVAVKGGTAFDQRTRTGVRVVPEGTPAPAADAAPAPDAPAGEGTPAPTEKGTPFAKEGVAQEIAIEALDALIGKLNGLRTAVTGGTLTPETFEETFRGWWDIRSAIETYTAIAAAAPAPAAAPSPEEMAAAANKDGNAPAPGATTPKPPDADPPSVGGTPAPVVDAEPNVSKSVDLAGPRKTAAELFKLAKSRSTRVTK